MNFHRYSLQPYTGPNSRFRCPACGKPRTFSRYIDTQTGEALADFVGRCSREDKCQYHYKPKQYFQEHQPVIAFRTQEVPLLGRPKPKAMPSASFVPFELFKASLTAPGENNLVCYLAGIFGPEITGQLVSRYFIGSSKHWPASTVFWQIDLAGRVRAGKIMLYSQEAGKRVKQPFPHITWIHKVEHLPGFELRQCMFGEHLLKEAAKPVAIVESEKTALIASLYFPGFLWLAVGSLSNLNEEKCRVLSGRSVCLFPDLNGFGKWQARARELAHIAAFQVSDLLERKATPQEREQGLDLADYLLRFDLRQFQNAENKPVELPQPEPEPPYTIRTLQPIAGNPYGYLQARKRENWGQEVDELELFFQTSLLPIAPVRLNTCSTVTDASRFIRSHLGHLKANKGNATFLPHLERLKALKHFITSKQSNNEKTK